MFRNPQVSAAGANVVRTSGEAAAAADHTLLAAECLDTPGIDQATVQFFAAVNECAVAGGERG
jgi:hypothetical protein